MRPINFKKIVGAFNPHPLLELLSRGRVASKQRRLARSPTAILRASCYLAILAPTVALMPLTLIKYQELRGPDNPLSPQITGYTNLVLSCSLAAITLSLPFVWQLTSFAGHKLIARASVTLSSAAAVTMTLWFLNEEMVGGYILSLGSSDSLQIGLPDDVLRIAISLTTSITGILGLWNRGMTARVAAPLILAPILTTRWGPTYLDDWSLDYAPALPMISLMSWAVAASALLLESNSLTSLSEYVSGGVGTNPGHAPTNANQSLTRTAIRNFGTTIAVIIAAISTWFAFQANYSQTRSAIQVQASGVLFIANAEGLFIEDTNGFWIRNYTRYPIRSAYIFAQEFSSPPIREGLVVTLLEPCTEVFVDSTELEDSIVDVEGLPQVDDWTMKFEDYAGVVWLRSSHGPPVRERGYVPERAKTSAAQATQIKDCSPP